MSKLSFIFSFLCVASLSGSELLLTPAAEAGVYNVKVSGMETDCGAMLVKEDLSGKISTTMTYLREDGVLAALKEEMPPLELNLKETAPGEPVILNVLLCDRTRSTAKKPEYPSIRFIPKPLEVKNEAGVYLACEIADVKAQSFWIRMSGLLPNEEVTFRSTLFGEHKILRECADENGEMKFFFLLEEVYPEEETFHITASNDRFRLTI
jgi:hypothetical protein